MAKRSGTTDQIADRLHSAAVHFLRRVAREDEAGGLSAARLSALSVAVLAGPLTLGELADAEGVRPPTMTRIVAALEEDGLVRREIDDGDGRVTIVRATAKGIRTLDRARARRLKLLRSGLAGLSRADTAALGRAAELLEHVARRP
jgi:DNA-binding MarR family transcriptional regulator